MLESGWATDIKNKKQPKTKNVSKPKKKNEKNFKDGLVDVTELKDENIELSS